MKKIAALFLFALLMTLACGSSDVRDPSKSTVAFHAEIIAEIVDPRISEISGMALSRRAENILWVINDSGDAPRLYAINTEGEIIAVVEIRGAENFDWEDLTSLEIDGEPHLLIADIGNNVVHRDVFSLYLIKEPPLQNGAMALERRIDFQYSDGARDCESIAFDSVHQKILLLSKRDVPAVLYELDFSISDDLLTAQRVGEVYSIPQPIAEETIKHLDQFHAQPTAMDVLPDDSKLAVLTYRRLFVYSHQPGEALIASLNNMNRAMIEYPPLEQAEAMCFGFDQKSVLITTEKLPAQILRIRFD